MGKSGRKNHGRESSNQAIPLKAYFGRMQGLIQKLGIGSIPIIYQLQDEFSVLEREKINAILLGKFGTEIQHELVPDFEDIIPKLQELDTKIY